MDLKKQRQDRIAQAKHRSTGVSHKTVAENNALLLAWEAAVLSEGQVSKALGVDRLEIRRMRAEAIQAGVNLADALLSGARREKVGR